MSLFAREPRSYTNERMAQDGTVSHEEATGASDNPWLPIDTMPLSTLGSRVDISDDGVEHHGITVTRLRTSRTWAGRDADLAPSWDDFEVTVFDDRRLELSLDREAEWRPHG